LPDDADSIEEVKKISALSNFKIKGLFSHFATADDADKSHTKIQEQKYAEFYEKLKAVGINIGLRTLANSAGIMQHPSSHYDAVRPGIILYGCYPSDEVDKNDIFLKPVMSVKANIVKLKKVPVGASVGYGRKFIAERESLIATITLGYADGYPRPYSRFAKVIINGVFAPIAGNICMDQCMIDVTDVPDVKSGDEVIIIGSDGKNTILADDIAAATGTINYEITCAFGQRLPKVFIKP
jgi:alanine racemase